MLRMTLVTRMLCRVGCLAAALAALVAFSPRSEPCSSGDRSIQAREQAPASIVAAVREVTKADASHRRASPTLLRARGEELSAAGEPAPRVFGVEIDAPFMAPSSTAHSPRAPPVKLRFAIRAS